MLLYFQETELVEAKALRKGIILAWGMDGGHLIHAYTDNECVAKWVNRELSLWKPIVEAGRFA